MLDRSSSLESHFDLLPFIAILMCLLGTLLLITMSMASIHIGPGVGEGWVAVRGSQEGMKTPLLVEWDGETATVQYEEGIETIALGHDAKEWKTGEGAFANPAMEAFLAQRVEDKDAAYVLFAVRPSGFDNFQILAQVFRDAGVGVGYEPIEQDKKVKLQGVRGGGS